MTTKNLAWYQNRIVSQVSFISAVIAVPTAIIAVMWAIRVTNQNTEEIKWLKDKQIQQLQINAKVETILTMR